MRRNRPDRSIIYTYVYDVYTLYTLLNLCYTTVTLETLYSQAIWRFCGFHSAGWCAFVIQSACGLLGWVVVVSHYVRSLSHKTVSSLLQISEFLQSYPVFFWLCLGLQPVDFFTAPLWRKLSFFYWWCTFPCERYTCKAMKHLCKTLQINSAKPTVLDTSTEKYFHILLFLL